MLRRIIIAGVIAVVAVFGISLAGWSFHTPGQDSESAPAADSQPVINERMPAQHAAVVEQQQAAWAQLVDHHVRIVEQREVVQMRTWEHHQRVSQQLGPRAPKTTPPPMPTVPPLHD